MSDPVLDLQGIAVSAGGQQILNVAHFAVAAGETVALVGPNGAGKTTLLHVAALLRQPDQGMVTILGESATLGTAARLRRSMAVVFQDPLLFDVDVLSNTAAGVRFQGGKRVEAERQARRWLSRFGVEHLAGRRARKLSGGEAARVALARAFATDPAILLLDEPFTALDAPTRASLLPTLRMRLQETGAAAVLVTHDLEEAFAFAGRIDLMESGEVIASGPGATLMARPPSRRAAELLGIETILAARVAGFEGDLVLVRIAPTGPELWACPPSGDVLRPGESVTVSLPASGIVLTTDDGNAGPGWNRLPGVVIGMTLLPTGRQVVVDTPTSIVAMAPWQPSGHELMEGERVVVSFAPECVHVIREGA